MTNIFVSVSENSGVLHAQGCLTLIPDPLEPQMLHIYYGLNE